MTVIYTPIAKFNVLTFWSTDSELLKRKAAEPAEDTPHLPGFPATPDCSLPGVLCSVPWRASYIYQLLSIYHVLSNTICIVICVEIFSLGYHTAGHCVVLSTYYKGPQAASNLARPSNCQRLLLPLPEGLPESFLQGPSGVRHACLFPFSIRLHTPKKHATSQPGVTINTVFFLLEIPKALFNSLLLA